MRAEDWLRYQAARLPTDPAPLIEFIELCSDEMLLWLGVAHDCTFARREIIARLSAKLKVSGQKRWR